MARAGVTIAKRTLSIIPIRSPLHRSIPPTIIKWFDFTGSCHPESGCVCVIEYWFFICVAKKPHSAYFLSPSKRRPTQLKIDEKKGQGRAGVNSTESLKPCPGFAPIPDPFYPKKALSAIFWNQMCILMSCFIPLQMKPRSSGWIPSTFFMYDFDVLALEMLAGLHFFRCW